MPRLVVVLDITGDFDEAFEAVDNALDNGVLQDAINDYEDSDDEDTEDDEGDDTSSVHVTSAVVRSPSGLIDDDATTRALRALGIEGDTGMEPTLISRSLIRTALIAALEGNE